jgi:Ni,Fe-hydrogenase III small subunit/formate hydrogenlyase subunit 6/NADH:ubiquinone oxidoreductase subunit I
MFDILRKSLATGIVTSAYPASAAEVSSQSRGAPEIDFANLKDAPGAAAACPTGALSCTDTKGARTVSFDLSKCTFCGLCAEVDRAIRMTNKCELAVLKKTELITAAKYQLLNGALQKRLTAEGAQQDGNRESIDVLGARVKSRVDSIFNGSLHIREVDAGSCNGCEIEVVGLNSPVYDLERFGIHFVASPRHADMLLVTGPVSRNMELALRKTYEATPEPRIVIAAGACACSGGIFGQNYASVGGVDKVVPVDVYVPGCPPNPHALLYGILMAIKRL